MCVPPPPPYLSCSRANCPGWDRCVLVPAALASLSNDLSDVGIRIGVGFFITSFGLLIGNPIAGALLNPGFRWSHLIIFCGVEMLGAAAVSVGFGRWWCGRRGGRSFR
ncbi:hypothetical protein A0H81_03444 [Grifola frondosa]|uniref:Major facilitator superfamily (MFS) profile domain-containing protein n=1 Tax=Grifola frondosa TaxID=5627 RepID=A0A1C7MIV2_GRIFR|nr:hypothetical protein A0H81_03444 [Grifola frondosa]